MKRTRVLVVAAIAVAAVAFYFLWNRGDAAGDGLSSSGTVEATDAALGFQMAGRIARIGPREGDPVTAGDTLAVLEHAELDARRAQAQAAVSAARAQLRDIEAGARDEEIAQAREAATAAAQRLTDAQRDLARIQRLFDGGAVAREALDKAKLAVDVATAQRNQADEQVKLLVSGPREARVAAQRAAIVQAEAALRQTDALLQNAIIVAPFDGTVAVRDREPGETVGAGAPVLTIVNFADRWVRIYISENRIGAISLGQEAAITSDTYQDRTYAGVVSFIANQAEFTPRNVQTQEERVKLVYAVKVRVTGDPGLELKPGMPVDVVLR